MRPVKVVSAENYVGWSEGAKCSAIAKVFDDAYKVSSVGLCSDCLHTRLASVHCRVFGRMCPFALRTAAAGCVMTIKDTDTACEAFL